VNNRCYVYGPLDNTYIHTYIYPFFKKQISVIALQYRTRAANRGGKLGNFAPGPQAVGATSCRGAPKLERYCYIQLSAFHYK